MLLDNEQYFDISKRKEILLLSSRFQQWKNNSIHGIENEAVELRKIERAIVEIINETDSKKTIIMASSNKFYLFVENDNPFCNEVKRLLFPILVNRGEIIDYFEGKPILSNSPSYIVSQIKIGLQNFIQDENSTFGFVAFPKEPKWDEVFNRKLIISLEKKSKYLICFESGHSLVDLYRDFPEIQNSHILVIETDHFALAQNLLEDLEERFVKGKEKLHLVILGGPKHSRPALIRRNVYAEYCAGKIIQCLDDIHTYFRMTVLSNGTWKQNTAKELVANYLQQVDVHDPSVHTSFLCANDSVALGVIDALNEIASTDINFTPQEYSLFGFDGIKEFQNILLKQETFEQPLSEKLITYLSGGATVLTPFQEFAHLVEKFIENPWPIQIFRSGRDFIFETEKVRSEIIQSV